jgi:hypothetical protein
MIHVPAAAAKSISSAVEESNRGRSLMDDHEEKALAAERSAAMAFPYKTNFKKEGDTVVELDQFKYTLSAYDKPLVEVRDSL